MTKPRQMVSHTHLDPATSNKLYYLLIEQVGKTGESEGAVYTLERIIRERDALQAQVDSLLGDVVKQAESDLPHNNS